MVSWVFFYFSVNKSIRKLLNHFFVSLAVILFDNKILANGHVIGDEAVNDNVAPYQLSLRYADDHICGASLITSKLVLTAAHCKIDSAPLHKYSVVPLSRNVKQQSARIFSFSAHPHYEKTKLSHYDIAVLWLEDEIQLEPSMKFAKLPNQFERVPYNEVANIATWNPEKTPENLLKPDIDPPKKIRTIEVIIHANKDYDDKEQFWSPIIAGTEDGEDGVCEGDEGSPLVVDGVQVGILSSAQRDGANSTAIYSRVSAFSDWISLDLVK